MQLIIHLRARICDDLAGDKLLTTANPAFDEDMQMFETLGLKGKAAFKNPLKPPPGHIEEPTPPTDELEQPAAGVVVLLVTPEVLGEVGDPLGEQSNLDLGGAGVAFLTRMFTDDFRLALSCHRHGVLL